jgi:hypothetical protein
MQMDELIAENHAIRTTLSTLESRVASIELQLQGNGLQDRSSFDFARIKADVTKITQEIFPGKCEFTVECDPEYPDDTYVVVNVETSGDPKDLVARSGQWHERIGRLSDDCFDNLRLSIVPR